MDQEQGWVFLLKKKLIAESYHYKVINISASGSTTSNGVERLATALKEYQPKVSIIALGGNDGLRGLPVATITNNLTKMVALAKDANSRVLIVGVRLPPNYGPLYTEQFQKIFTTVAKKEGVPVVPMMLKQVAENNDLFQADGIHPTAAAQSQIMSNIWAKLQPMI